MDDINFCPACGKELPSGTAYCPACGSRLDDPEADRKETVAAKKENDDRIKIAVIMLAITAVVSIISGIYFYLSAAGFMEMIVNMLPEDTLSPSAIDSMENMLRVTGLISVAAGAVSAAAAFMAYKRRMWTVTIILCAVSMIAGNLILGIIALWMLLKVRSSFTD
ncbi:MAG: zinc-ribbon domain-containing protein [Methanomassiliicoccaceae archaeon]|nr:zinc-ribbon domain-containing protein [Methanomassiliicoccaceae archaeon]